MNEAISARDLDYRWAPATAITGSVGILAYIIVLAATQSTSLAVTLGFAFAFGIAVSSIGLYHVLGGGRGSQVALIAAVANVMAAGELLAMLMVQLSAKAMVAEPGAGLIAVWLGLDLAWDLLVGTGTVLFALSMLGRQGLGAWLAAPGLAVGGLLLVLNIATFPTPPAEAGLVDLGPLVGLWYLVVYGRLAVSSALLSRRLRGQPARLDGARV